MESEPIDWVKEFPGAITVCDTRGTILSMNEQAAAVYKGQGGRRLVGTNILDCHPEPARTKLGRMMEDPRSNVLYHRKKRAPSTDLPYPLVSGWPLYRFHGTFSGNPSPDAPFRAERITMNWKAIEREATDLLSEYLRIDTTNPPGKERQAIEFLGRLLKQEGLAFEIVGTDPDRPNLICRLSSGKDRKGLMLLHHCDVVGADPREWEEASLRRRGQGGVCLRPRRPGHEGHGDHGTDGLHPGPPS